MPQSSAPNPASPLRRLPQQARAERRVESLLDAAAEIIAAGGLAAATTNAIAERAGASVGTLYQFFPNRESIFLALAERYGRQFDDVKDAIFGPSADGRSVELTVATIVNAIGDFCDAHPAYAHVYHHELEGLAPTAVQGLHAAAITQVSAMLGRRYPRMQRAERQAVAFTHVHAVHAVILATLVLPAAARRAPRAALVRLLADGLARFETE